MTLAVVTIQTEIHFSTELQLLTTKRVYFMSFLMLLYTFISCNEVQYLEEK